jgi:hypothetical protein
VSVSEQAEVAVESDAVEGDIDSSIEVTEATAAKGDMADDTPQAPMTSKDEESRPSELVATDDPAVELAETAGRAVGKRACRITDGTLSQHSVY